MAIIPFYLKEDNDGMATLPFHLKETTDGMATSLPPKE